MSASFAAAQTGPLAPNLTDGLVESLDFQSDLSDSSGQGTNAVFASPVFATDRFGITNGALHFPGTAGQGVVIPDLPQFQTPYFTLACWYRTVDVGNEQQLAVKLRVPQVDNGQWSLYISRANLPSPIMRFAFARNGVFQYVASTNYLTLTNQWQFVAASWDGTNEVLYLNGVEAGRNTAAPPGGMDVFGPGAQITLGIAPPPIQTPYPFTGDLDDFKLYNRALTAGEVMQLYDGTSGIFLTKAAEAVARVDNGFVVQIILTENGFGYTNTPTVSIIGGGGSGASAVALMTNGAIKSIKVTNPGIDYTNAPTIRVDPPAPTDAMATATVTNGLVTSIDITDPGWLYASPPTVSIIGGGGSGASAVATLTGGLVTSIQIVDPGHGYTNAPLIRIDPPFAALNPPTSVLIDVSAVKVTMKVAPNRIYVVESSLDAKSWSQVGAEFISASDSITKTFDVAQAVTLFRVRDVTPHP